MADMTLGEKLTSLECMVHDFARTRLKEAGLDPSLSEIVMGRVYRRFQETAYHASLFRQVAVPPKPVKQETHEGTVEDLMKEVQERGAVHSEEK